MNEFGSKLKALRKEARLSQTMLAEKLLTSQDTVSLWERGKSFPDFSALISLCNLFDVSADYLLGLKEY